LAPDDVPGFDWLFDGKEPDSPALPDDPVASPSFEHFSASTPGCSESMLPGVADLMAASLRFSDSTFLAIRWRYRAACCDGVRGTGEEAVSKIMMSGDGSLLLREPFIAMLLLFDVGESSISLLRSFEVRLAVIFRHI
ncbi:hypothetical protein PENTCL1PPCAC_13094, partial [Pristionchus entomophagus]